MRKIFFIFININYFRTLSTSITTDNLGTSSPPARPSLINTHDGYESRSKSISASSTHQENIPPIPISLRSMTISTESMIIIELLKG